MSNELKQFYRELWAWIQDGCPEHAVFCKNSAICRNLALWSGYQVSLTKENNDLLVDVFGDSLFPFNVCRILEFVQERRAGTTYKNPERLDFIEECAK